MTRISKRVVALAALLLSATLVAAPVPPAGADPAGYSYHPSWHRVHFHMNAYHDAGYGPHGTTLGCEGTWSSDQGRCHGRGEEQMSYPFNSYTNWDWHRQATHCPDFAGRDHHVFTHELRIVSYAVGWGPSQLCGWVDAHWGTYVITSGRIYTNAGWHHVRTTSAVVGDREHTQGGPLFVFLGHRTGGYVLGLRGWIHY
jgi:hypothetical protein